MDKNLHLQILAILNQHKEQTERLASTRNDKIKQMIRYCRSIYASMEISNCTIRESLISVSLAIINVS